METVANRLKYEKGATSVQTPAPRGARARPGRLPGLRARPDRRLPPRRHPGPVRQRLPLRRGARGRHGASHAWVDVHDDERGWVSLDPTHRREQDEKYVRVAVGRDYADVPPTRGVFKGNAEETLSVKVAVAAC